MARARVGNMGTAAEIKPWGGGGVSCGLTPETCSPLGSAQEPWDGSETPGDVCPGHCGACPADEMPLQP